MQYIKILVIFFITTSVYSENIKSEFGLDYVDSKDFPLIIFQDGMIFGEKQSWQVSQKLAELTGRSVGRINIKVNPSINEKKLTIIDILLNRTYSFINDEAKKQNKKILLLLFMTANNQFIKASEVAKLNNVKYDNFSIINIANQWSSEQRINEFNKSQKTGIHPFDKFLNNQQLLKTIKEF